MTRTNDPQQNIRTIHIGFLILIGKDPEAMLFGKDRAILVANTNLLQVHRDGAMKKFTVPRKHNLFWLKHRRRTKMEVYEVMN